MHHITSKRSLRQRLTILASAGALAGVGGVALILPTHLTAHAAGTTVNAEPAAGGTAPDTDTVQQGDQTDVTGAADTAAAEPAGTAAEATGPEADGPGGNADPAGAAGPDGDFNN